MDTDAVLKSIEDVAPSKGYPIIGPKRGALLEEVVAEHSPARVLEVGTLVGYSAIRIGRHLPKDGKMTCIEVNGKIAEVARSNFDKAGLSDKIQVIVGDGKALVKSVQGPLDMVFIDAEKVEYLTYLKGCEKALHRGSVVVADNVKSFANEMADYLDYVRNSGKFRSTYHEAPANWGSDEPDAIEVSVLL